MLERNYKFYIYTSLEKRTENSSFYHNRVIIKHEDIDHYRDKTLNPFFDGIVMNYLTQVQYLNKMNRNNFSFMICKEKYINNRMVFYLRKDYHLVDELSKVITGLLENGIMNHWRIKYLDFHINQVKNVEGPDHLNFHELLGSFKLYFGGVVISVCVFIIEIIVFNREKLKKKFKKNITKAYAAMTEKT